MTALGAVGIANHHGSAMVLGGYARPIGKMKLRGRANGTNMPKPKPKREMKHGQFRVI